MRWPWRRDGHELRSESSSFADAVVSSILRAAGGIEKAETSSSGALEVAAGVVGRAFASAGVSPGLPALTPELLFMIGRELIRRGECVLAIDTSGGRLRLFPVSTWDITGGHAPESWRYRVDLAGPSGMLTRDVPGPGLLHFRYAVDPSRPWRGLGPLQVALSAGELTAEAERLLADEAGGARGNLLPIPSDGQDGTVTRLRRDIAGLRGKTALVETTQGGWGDGGQMNSPQTDWKPSRLGANPPESLVTANRDSQSIALAACGVPPELVSSGDGVATREAWRRFLFGTVRPMGELVQTELRDKLEREYTLDWTDLRAIDVESRARAYKQLRQGDMEAERAARHAGLA